MCSELWTRALEAWRKSIRVVLRIYCCCTLLLSGRTTYDYSYVFATRASDVNVVRLPVSFSVWRMEWVKQFLVSFLVFSCRSTTTWLFFSTWCLVLSTEVPIDRW